MLILKFFLTCQIRHFFITILNRKKYQISPYMFLIQFLMLILEMTSILLHHIEALKKITLNLQKLGKCNFVGNRYLRPFSRKWPLNFEKICDFVENETFQIAQKSPIF